MSNYTFEDYKKAIKAKYLIEEKGKHSADLMNPSRARLRNLCMDLFKESPDKNDLSVFASFFKFEFTPSCSAKVKELTDKFRPIENFFKGETDLVDRDAVEMAAILVDFQPRPYLKFLKSDLSILSQELVETKPENKKVPKTEEHPNVMENLKSTTFPQRKLLISLAVGGILVLGFAISRFVFPEKQCMQWSDDHYEVVNCDLEVNALVSLKNVEPFDKRKCELQKITICDTTSCFKNGVAIIWYAKTETGIDFFNTHGRHPQNDKPLKPVTQYILNKYVVK
ncbi:hypothetical protein [Flavobacterium algicola]|uniref:hypothetical protein n=1 Tax=Flavobacterium algicola TaxID=556529 RepID=UPI001EFE42A0|nr:hypothetical protein [Flavobacterium algicola]MCG9791168.1 hypothetical protein [Flavobacterium algicola]